MKIAVLGDLHYPSIYNEDGTQLSSEVIKARDRFFTEILGRFFDLEADHYVSIGDLTNYGRLDEFEEVFSIIGANIGKFTLTLGNHDLYTMTREEIQAAFAIQYNQLVETQHANLLFLETARERDLNNWSGELSEQQLDLLERVVVSSDDKALIIFGHHPIYDTTAKSTDKYLSIDPSIGLAEILSKRKGPGFYICGHNHAESIVEKRAWQFLQLPSVIDSGDIYMLDINEDDVRIEIINLSDSDLADQGEIIGNGINHFTLAKYNED